MTTRSPGLTAMPLRSSVLNPSTRDPHRVCIRQHAREGEIAGARGLRVLSGAAAFINQDDRRAGNRRPLRVGDRSNDRTARLRDSRSHWHQAALTTQSPPGEAFWPISYRPPGEPVSKDPRNLSVSVTEQYEGTMKESIVFTPESSEKFRQCGITSRILKIFRPHPVDLQPSLDRVRRIGSPAFVHYGRTNPVRPPALPPLFSTPDR